MNPAPYSSHVKNVLMNWNQRIAVVIAVLLPFPAQAAELPSDVAAFLHREFKIGNCRLKQMEGKTPEELSREFSALLASKACSAQEAERRALADRYKGNRTVLMALVPKIGFVGVERFEPAPAKQ